MILTGADIVLRDRVLRGGSLVIAGDRIAAIEPAARVRRADAIDVTGRIIAAGLIDVHVHGAAGHDVLGGAGSVARVAEALPRWGVTAFSPTSIACAPDPLSVLLTEVAALRAEGTRAAASARVLPAHLESNFINPDYRGAQPLPCLRTARVDDVDRDGDRNADRDTDRNGDGRRDRRPSPNGTEFSARDILRVIDRHRADISAISMAPEIDGGFDLLRAFVAGGIAVSLGHSAATFDEANHAIAAGASRATHLFNRMPPLHHREPGLAGAILASDSVTAEIICDAVHVHPAMVRSAIAAKKPERIMAITDGTAGSGLPAGTRSRLGSHTLTVGDVARLEDGTIAGSVATMDQVLRMLVTEARIDLVQAVEICSTTPAKTLRLHDQGELLPGRLADFVVLTQDLAVLETWIGGQRVYSG